MFIIKDYLYLLNHYLEVEIIKYGYPVYPGVC